MCWRNTWRATARTIRKPHVCRWASCSSGRRISRKFVQTPGLIVILYEASSGIRQIFTDGRPLPPKNDPQPWYYGYSSGKWEGDTLVVQTNNLRDDGWLDIIGTPLTDEATLTERFRRVNFGRMEIDITSMTRRLHEVVDRQTPPGHHAGYRYHRVHLRGEQPLHSALTA